MEIKKEVIKSFYKTLMNKDTEEILSLCTEDATLTWAFFTFKGKKEIKSWSKELEKHFTELKLENISVAQEKESACDVAHKFNIIITSPNGRIGLVPAIGRYKFKHGKLQHIWINPLRGRGYILVKRRDLPERLQATI